MFNFLKKKQQSKQVAQPFRKSMGAGEAFSLLGSLQNGNNWDISFSVLRQYYKNCAPLTDAIDTISDEFSTIVPVVKDTQTGQFVDNHLLVERLRDPGKDRSISDFLKLVMAETLITGNPLLVADGSIDKPPVMLDIEKPENAELIPNAFGEIKMVKVDSQFNKSIYERERDVLVTKERMSQINPMFLFNPNHGTAYFFGLPIATPLYHYIEQILSGGSHNMNLLENGATLNGIFNTLSDVPLTDPQWERMKKEVHASYTGAKNAGKDLLMENVGFIPYNMKNKDLEYSEMQSTAKQAIKERYKIPLATYSDKAMTYNNLQASRFALYDSCILVWGQMVYDNLTQALMPRYEKDPLRYQLTYDEKTISALRGRMIDTAKTLTETRVAKVDEIRVSAGLNAIEGAEGESILVPRNLLPLADSEE